MLAEISAGYSSLKAAIGIVQGMNATNTQVQINEVKIQLQQLLLDAQAALMGAQASQSDASARINQLEQEIERLKDWSTDKERYQLANVWRGAVAYIPKPGMENGEPPHWLCANCFLQGRKSYLVHKGQQTGEATYGCDACQGTMRVSYRTKPEQITGEQVPDAL